MEHVVVVGAGPGGLAVAAMLRAQGIDALVVDRADSVGASWRAHYDRLHLHTARRLSGLPGLPMPRSYGRYVARDHVVEYLERYAAHHRLRISLGTEVRRLDRTGDGWRLDVAAGPLFATYAVVATGHNSVPALPGWPGLDRFRGEIVHASTYRNPRPYAGRDVLVVGAGNSGAEIAVDLVEGGAARVRLAVRTPPNITDVRAPGLWFTGFTNPISGMLRELAIDARRIARAVSDSVAAAGTRSSVG